MGPTLDLCRGKMASYAQSSATTATKLPVCLVGLLLQLWGLIASICGCLIHTQVEGKGTARTHRSQLQRRSSTLVR